MADKEISELTAATTPLAGTELVHIDQGGDSRKVALTDVVAIATGAMLKAVYDPNDDGVIAVAQGGTNATTASGARTNLGLGTMAVQNAGTVAITGGSVTGITDLTVADGGTGASDASGARTNLGLAIGVDVMAYSANLAGFAATTVANVQNRDNHTGTQLAATISDFSTAADLRIAAAVGVSVQAYDALLASVSSLALTAGDIIYATGPDAVAVLPIGGAGQLLSITGGLPAWDTSLVVGGLLAANNLSDVDDTADARVNLAVPPVAADRTAIAALDASKDTTVLLAEAGYQGNFDAVDNTGGTYDDLIAADTVGGEIKVTTGNPNLAYLRQRKNGDLFKTSEFGGGEAGFRAALAVAAERHPGGTVEVNERGTVGPFTAGVTIPWGVHRIVGLGDTRLDGSGILTTGAMSNFFFLNADEPTGLVALPSFTAVLKGERFMTFASTPDVAAGDMVTIYNEVDFSFLNITGRETYRDGEHNEVVAVVGNDVYFLYPFENDYTYVGTVGASLKAYKAPTRPFAMEGLIVDLDGNPIVSTNGTRALRVMRGKDVAIKDVALRGFTYAGVWTEQCMRVLTERVKSSVRPGSLGGGHPVNQYPLFAINSRGTTRRGCASISGWHADSLGGSGLPGCVPNSDYYAEDCDFTTTGTVTATESHGNSRRVTRYNCRIYGGGISLGGGDVTYQKCKVRITNSTSLQAVVIAEPWGGKYQILDCDIYSAANMGGSGGTALFHYDGGGGTGTALKQEVFVEWTGGKVEAPNETTFGRIRVNHATYPVSLNFEAEIIAPNLTNHLFRIERGGPGTAGAATLCRIMPKGIKAALPYATWLGGYTATNYEFPPQSGTQSITTTAVTSVTGDAVPLVNGYPVVPTSVVSMHRDIGGVPFFVTNQGSNPTAAQVRFVLHAQTAGGNLPAGTAQVAWRATARSG